MSSTTFDEAVHLPEEREYPELAAIQRLFVEPLKELKALKMQWEKTRVGFQTRLSRIHHRVQQAERAGVTITQASGLVGSFLNELQGSGRTRVAGLLPSIGPQIENGITKMECFSAEHIAHREEWGSWIEIPSRIRDNIHAVEERLAQLETLVADGGPLQNLVEQAAARKAGETGP